MVMTQTEKYELQGRLHMVSERARIASENISYHDFLTFLRFVFEEVKDLEVRVTELRAEPNDD